MTIINLSERRKPENIGAVVCRALFMTQAAGGGYSEMHPDILPEALTACGRQVNAARCQNRSSVVSFKRPETPALK